LVTVLRRVILSTLALLTLGACATTAPYASAPRAPYAQPAGPNIYATAAFATLHSEMFACGAYGSNIGEIGARREVIAYSPYIDTPAGAVMRYPTEDACLSSGFGWRTSLGGAGREHTGLDLANPNGGFVYAAAAGRVIFADWRGGYGLALELDHGRGVHTFYAHLNEIDQRLQPGMYVPAGAPVARMGNTGNATGTHLHYEVIVDGVRVDPLHYGAPAPPPPIEPVITAVTQDEINAPIE
jgi:murein DD-endopeptidase MepM/ murein hydrolase activator NlpD